jgi:hypothetical protein
MSPEKLLELFRLETDDTSEPYLWSDDEFFIYLNDAQDMHTRVTGGISDRTSALTKLTYKSGDQFLTYDDRILRIKGAWDETNRRIGIKNLDNLESLSLEDDYGTNRTDLGLDDSVTGDLKYIVTDVEDNKIQIYPLADHTGWVRLFVFRRPLETVTEDSETLEIPSQYHLNLLNWVKYKAFMKQDVETFEGSRAVEFRQAFSDGLTEAKRDRAARQDRKRTVAYGGIPMS